MDSETLTSGASARIIPVFHRFLRVFVFFHSILLWFLLLPRRGKRKILPTSAVAASAPPLSPRRRSPGRFRRAEEEDVRRRRALAEGLDMGGGGDSFVIEGRRRNVLFCRWWAPISGGDVKGILVIIHGLNEHSPIDSVRTVVGVRLFSRE